MADDKSVIYNDRLRVMPDHADSGPSKSASKADWVDHAVAAGVEPAEAEAMTRDELVAEFGT